MKKEKKFADISPEDVIAKQQSLIRELVKFKVSMDPSHIQNSGGIVGLRKDLRIISRKIETLRSQSVKSLG